MVAGLTPPDARWFEHAGSAPLGAASPAWPAEVLNSTSGATIASPAAPRPESRSGTAPVARFTTGQIVADRYRIVSLLGEGGMGQVYRAEDIVLGMAVALKFLPPRLSGNRRWMEQVAEEVRLSRRISHQNVCRIHDLGEHMHEPFVVMEFVSGENLAQVLRRVGRLSGERAVDIARQTCLALAAVHEQGLLHRDLKPANVMIDEAGIVKLTDFGLAASHEDLDKQPEAPRGQPPPLIGTPLYMAPEQWMGGRLSLQTDLYALGLVLYELFTARRAFDGTNLDTLRNAHLDRLPVRPSEFISDIDPAVEQAIMRCLEKEPYDRPPSAFAVSAMLPGGDPLALAVAEQRTPSPSTLAAAGVGVSMAPTQTIALLAGIAALLVAILTLAPHANVLNLVPMPTSPGALAGRAQVYLADVGLFSPAVNRYEAWSFSLDRPWLNELRDQQISADAWRNRLQSHDNVIQFWYRASPTALTPVSAFPFNSPDDPPLVGQDQVLVRMNSVGELRELHAPPPALAILPEPAQQERADLLVTRWQRLYARAAIQPGSLRPLPSPSRRPPSFADRHEAFAATLLDGQEVRIEQASLGGRVVWFAVLFAWTGQAADQMHFRPRESILSGSVVESLLIIAIIVTAVLLAHRHVRQNRADRPAALRMAMVTGGLGLAMNLFAFLSNPSWLLQFNFSLHATGRILVAATAGALFYLAFEPLARRAWPQGLVSWSRLMRGTCRCGAVARDVLIGLLIGLFAVLCLQLAWLVTSLTDSGVSPLLAHPMAIRSLQGLDLALAGMASSGLFGIYDSMIVFIVLLAARAMFTRRITMILASALVLTLLFHQSSYHCKVGLAFSFAYFAVAALIWARLGLVCVVAAMVSFAMMMGLPLPSAQASWAVPSAMVGVVGIGLLAAWAGWVSFSVARPGETIRCRYNPA